jgi:YggT family protein
MFVFGNLLHALAYILDAALTIYMWIIIIAALISWVNPDPYNPIVRFLYSVTDPVLRPIRKRIGIAMGIDISPLIVILIIMFIKYFLVASLFDMAFRIRGRTF